MTDKEAATLTKNEAKEKIQSIADETCVEIRKRGGIAKAEWRGDSCFISWDGVELHEVRVMWDGNTGLI